MDFENTSYHGLFQFIRYMEQLERYQVDFGEVSLYGELADTVRIMTIHKSKGLEFPVVFVCGLGGKDECDGRQCPGTASCVPGHRTGVDPPERQDPQHASGETGDPPGHPPGYTGGRNCGVLYVALTRAKEKLILTGTVDDLEKKFREIEGQIRDPEGRLTYRALSGAKCYWDWVPAGAAGAAGGDPAGKF